jgi:hypothetical protein
MHPLMAPQICLLPPMPLAVKNFIKLRVTDRKYRVMGRQGHLEESWQSIIL